MRPVIGVTSYVEPASWSAWSQVPAALVPVAYVRQINAAGGTAVVLPPLPQGSTQSDARDVLRRIDALVLSGGADVESARYGDAPHPRAQEPRRDRDASELLLARVSASIDLPLLGVCRGMQIMAVAAGGALEQHLPDRLDSSRHAPGRGYYGSHGVRVAAGSRLHDILGDEVRVPSYHHQGVEAAPGYQACAWADDGVLEAIEDVDATFRIGVQWHPEAGDDPRLFQELVSAARTAHRSRA